MPIDFQPETKIDFRPEIDFQPEPQKEEPIYKKGLTYRPFADLRSMLQKTGLGRKPEEIKRVMERSKWEIEGLKQWTKGYWDTVTAKGTLSGKSEEAVKKFQKLERRLSEEKRNPIDALEKVGMAGMAIYFGVQAGQILEPAFVSAIAKLRPDLAKTMPTAIKGTEMATIPTPPSTPTKEPMVIWLSKGALAEPPTGGREIYAIDPTKLDVNKLVLSEATLPKQYYRLYGGVPQDAIITRSESSQQVAKILKDRGIDPTKIYYHTGKLPMVTKAEVTALVGKPPPVPPPPAPTEVPPAGDSVQRIITALKEAKDIRGKQETIYTAERGGKLARGLVAEERVIGKEGYEKGFYAKLGAFKGAMTKVQFEGIRGKVNPGDIESLFKNIKETSSLTEFEKLSAGKGLGKLFGEFGGTVPTEGELTLLRKVFPDEFVTTLLAKRPLLTKMNEAGYQLANIPRAIKSSFDLSFGFRQAMFMAPRHPILFMRSFGKQFRLFGSEKAYQQLMESIATDPNYELAQKSKLALTDLGPFLKRREEAFMGGQWAEKIPLIGRGVRASERAYTGFANSFRFDIFKYMVRAAEKLGYNPKENLDLTVQIANLVNVGTGRGGLGKLERAAVALNSFFYSPRLMSSRIQILTNPINPSWWIKTDPFVRKEYFKALFSFVGFGTTVLGLAKLAGAEVGLDWRSADFGKIKIGNTRIDIWGGHQQYIVLAARLITGKAVSSTTGKVMTLGEGYRPLTRLELIQRTIEMKESPVFSFASNLLRGQTFQGKPVNIPKEVGNLFVSMAIEDIYDVMVDDPDLLPVSLLGIFGVGLQTYKSAPSAFSFRGISKSSGGRLKLGGTASGKGRLSLGK